MGSRIMHLAISSIICEELTFEKKFILGGLAPDVQQQGDSRKFDSHFMKRNSDGEDRIYFKSFLFKYNTKFNDDFVKGYYSHLIADKFWLEGPYEKYIRPKPLAERRPVLEKFYHDYQVLNSFIIEKYNLEQLTLELLPENETITEIEYSRLPKIINETNGYFRDYMDLGETTTLLKKREIIDYIEKTAEKLVQVFSNRLDP
ncbi:hypothetical protein [Shouchella miscanthi]|uniref:hypothetical protein n=1 Tax=Shouchella miscanthi TaxID=2598861 RepID=UPI0011A2B04E|nr:hypothetical protein [Shouchella miscanthi]